MIRQHLVFAAACAGMLLFGIVFLSLGAVNNMLADRFRLDANEIGTLTALLPLGILAGSLVFGPVVDRFGYRWMLVSCALLVGSGLEGLAFAQDKRMIQAFVFLIGFGGGVLNGATNALAADVSEGQRGERLSLLGVFFGIGALTMPSTLALLSARFELTTIVAGIGAFVLLPVVYFLLIRFPPPKQQTGNFSLLRGFALLRDPIFLFAGLALAVQSGMEGMSNDWITRYFRTVTLGGEQAHEWQTQLGLMAVTGAIVVTRIVMTRLLRTVRSEHFLFASVAITACGALGLRHADSYPATLLSALLIGIGLAAAFPIVLSYIGDLYPAQSGTAFSMIFVIALAGNMVVNKAFGVIAHARGIEQYTTVMLVCLAVSAALLFVITRQLAAHPTQTHAHARETVAR